MQVSKQVDQAGRQAHSEGESLREGGKKRLGGNMHPQNGDIGGCVASCVVSEDYTMTSFTLWADPIISLVGRRCLTRDVIGSAQSAHLINCVILTCHTACLAPPNVTILRMYISEELLSDWALLGYARRPAVRGE